MTPFWRAITTMCAATLLMTGFARADGSGDPTPVASEDGKYTDKEGTPTFKIDKDGKVDFYTYVGFIRYSANCLRCHGPDGVGSTYGPALIETMNRLNYGDIFQIVASGMKNVSASQNLVMPALGDDKNVMCYLDAIFVYLRARGDGAIGRGRPAEHEPKPASFAKEEDECMR